MKNREINLITAYWQDDAQQIKTYVQQELSKLHNKEKMQKNFSDPFILNFVPEFTEQLTDFRPDLKIGYEEPTEKQSEELDNFLSFADYKQQTEVLNQATFLFNTIYVFITINKENPLDYKFLYFTNESEDFNVIEKSLNNRVLAVQYRIQEKIYQVHSRYSKVGMKSKKTVWFEKGDNGEMQEVEGVDIFPIVKYTLKTNDTNVWSCPNYRVVSANQIVNFNLNEMQLNLNYNGFRKEVVNSAESKQFKIQSNPDDVLILGDKNLEEYTQYPGGANCAEYIEVINFYLRAMAVMLGLNKNTFVVSADAESGISKMVEGSPLLKKLNKYGELIHNSEVKLLDKLLRMYNELNKSSNLDLDININYGDVQAFVSQEQKENIIFDRIKNKVLSYTKAIQELYGYNEEEAALYFKNIIEEQTEVSGAGVNPMMQQFGG